jgi:NhaP-type Na+/H+ or K+/H+ antiporter
VISLFGASMGLMAGMTSRWLITKRPVQPAYVIMYAGFALLNVYACVLCLAASDVLTGFVNVLACGFYAESAWLLWKANR